MLHVEKIEKKAANRCQVFLENGESFPLYQGEITAYQIREGEEILEQVYREIMQELLPKRACSRTLHLLLAMGRTRQQLQKKLQEAGYPASAIEYAMDYAAQYHYLDDLRYAWNYIECRKQSKSRRQLEYELSGKGVSEEQIEQAFELAQFPEESEQIQYWIEKKQFCTEKAGWEEKQKFSLFLQRKGFCSSEIRKCLG